MSKPPSDATPLRRCRSERSELERRYRAALLDADEYRKRAAVAEQEVKEWKDRCDRLIRAIGKEPTDD